jgi:hypothetical protein
MTARTAAGISSLAGALALAACTSFYEIPIETPIQPKLDVSSFQRVLIAGFITGGTDDVDTNLETVRLLRSQLRTKSQLRVLDADVLPLTEIAADQIRPPQAEPQGAADSPPQVPGLPTQIRSEKDLQAYDRLFANVSYWKKIGEEYQNPLIVTGTIFFNSTAASGIVLQNQEVIDAFGRRRVQPVRTYMERKGFLLIPRFIFIDGRTGTRLYSEGHREQVLYPAQQNTPALSSYFELMDRLVPVFLSTLSTQKIRGSRTLLK